MSSWAKTSLDRSRKNDFEILLSFHSDTKDDHAVNSLLGIFQKTSSNTYFLLTRNLMGHHAIKSFHSEINDGQELNRRCLFFKQHLFHPIYSIEYKHGGMRKATERLRIATIIPSTLSRWSCTKQSSWNSSTNIFFQAKRPLEQKLD